jgi:hypothetical protein
MHEREKERIGNRKTPTKVVRNKERKKNKERQTDKKKLRNREKG